MKIATVPSFETLGYCRSSLRDCKEVYEFNAFYALYEFNAINEFYAFYEMNEFNAINAINAVGFC
jgi:hypothetical protein